MRILGRRTDLINVGGNKVYPSEVECALLEMPNVRDVTVAGERNPLMGHIVVATIETIEPEDQLALSRRVRAFCRDKLAPHKIPVKVRLTERTELSPRFKKVRAR